MITDNDYTLISLFSGAMGLDIGLERAGFRTKVAIDIDKRACETIRLNKPNLPVIEGDINDISSDEILAVAGLRRGEVTLLAGGSPCQSFSTAGKRKAFEDDRGQLLLRFIKLVEEIQPEYFLLENVRGVLNARIKHRPIEERGKDFPPLDEEEQIGSVLKHIINRFNQTGYEVNFGLLNAADYGVPQTRERVIFFGSRVGSKVEIPIPTYSRFADNGQLPWVTFGDIMKQFRIK